MVIKIQERAEMYSFVQVYSFMCAGFVPVLNFLKDYVSIADFIVHFPCNLNQFLNMAQQTRSPV